MLEGGSTATFKAFIIDTMQGEHLRLIHSEAPT